MAARSSPGSQAARRLPEDDPGRDHRAHRWRPAVRRGADQGGPGIGAAPGRRRPLRPRGATAVARHSQHAPGLADGPPRPPRPGQGDRSDRRGIGREFDFQLLAAVRPRPEPELDSALDQLVAVRADLSAAAHAAGCDLHLQARPGPGGRLQQPAQEPGASSCTLGSPQVLEQQLPGSRWRTDRKCSPAIYTDAETDRTGRRLLASQPGNRRPERFAHKEAIAHLTRGLELLKGLARDAVSSAARSCSLQIALGISLSATKGPASRRCSRAYLRAQELRRADR